MSQNLIKKIRSYIKFNKEEEQFISSVFKLKYLAKGEHFLLAGDVCRETAFIESGSDGQKLNLLQTFLRKITGWRTTGKK